MPTTAQINDALTAVRDSSFRKKSDEELHRLIAIMRDWILTGNATMYLAEPAITAFENELSRRQLDKIQQQAIALHTASAHDANEKHKEVIEDGKTDIRLSRWILFVAILTLLVTVLFWFIPPHETKTGSESVVQPLSNPPPTLSTNAVSLTNTEQAKSTNRPPPPVLSTNTIPSPDSKSSAPTNSPPKS